MMRNLHSLVRQNQKLLVNSILAIPYYKILILKVILVVLGAFIGMKVEAQVSTLTNWTNLYNNTGNLTNGAVTMPAGSGSYRMLIVGVSTSQSAVGSRTVTVTYGSQTLTLANGDLATSTIRQHTALYYLNEAGIDAAGASPTLSATFSGGSVRVNTVWYSVYDYVDQTTLTTDSKNFNNNNIAGTACAFTAPGLTVNYDDRAVEVVGTLRVGNATPRTIGAATNWTSANEQTFGATDGMRSGVYTRSISTANVTDVSSHTISGSTLNSMTAISLHATTKQFRSNVASGNWGTLATWQQSMDNGTTWVAATTIPTSTDGLVTIQSGHTITLVANTTVSDLTVQSTGVLNCATLTLGVTGTPTNSGTIQTQNTSGTPIPTGMTWGGTVIFNRTTGGQSVPAGTFNNLTFSNTSGIQTAVGAITVNGTITTAVGGTLNMGTNQLLGTLTAANSGTIRTQNTTNPAIPSGDTWGGTVTFDATTGGQSVPAGTFNNLTFSNTSGTQTVVGDITVNGTMTTSAGGILNMGTNQLLGTLTTVTNGGTIQTQNTSSTPIPSGETWGGTVKFDTTTGGQSVPAGTYNNLTFSNTSGTQTAVGAITVNGTITTTAGGTLNMGTNQLLGTLTAANSGTIRTQNTTNPAIPTGDTWGGTVTFDATTGGQSVPAGTYNNLTFSNTSGTQTAVGAITVNGTLTTTAGGTLNMGTNQLLGTLTTVTNGGTIQTQNTSATPIPTGETWGGTILYNGGAQTIAVGTYNNLIFSGSEAKSMSNTGGTTSVTGNLSIAPSVTASVGAGLTINLGTLILGGNGTASGTWGSTTATTADYKNNIYFAATTGRLNVGTATWQTPTVTPTVETYTYNGSAQGPNAATNNGTGLVYTFSYVGVNGTTYATSATRPTNAGSYNVTATVTASTDGFYNQGSSTPTDFTIAQALLTVTATGPGKEYGTALTAGTSSTNFTHSGEVASESVSSVTLTPDAAGLSSTTAAGSTYVITPSLVTGTGGFLESNYSVTYNAYTGTVSKKPLTITATGPTKEYGTALTAGTSSTNFTHSGERSGELVTSVTLTPNAAGLSATTAAGSSYAVTPSLATGTGGFLESNYSVTYNAYTGTVSKKSLAITATNQSKTYGSAFTFGGNEFTSSGLQNSETIGSVTLTSTGSAAAAAVNDYPILPSAATGGTFNAANYTITYINGILTVDKKALTITASTVNKNYGATLSGGTGSTAFTSSGLANSETIGSVSISYGTGSAATAAVGTYSGSVTPSAATGGTFATGNYTITYASGNIVVVAVPLTITAINQSKTYGSAFTFGGNEFTSSGLQNSETIGSVTLSSTGSAAAAAVNTYPIVPSAAAGGTFNAANYTITYTSGTMTVGKALLTVTAENKSVTYGDAIPVLTYTMTGFFNGDTQAGAVTGQPALATGYTTATLVSASPVVITASIGTLASGNYDFSFVNGSISLSKKALNITAQNRSKCFGDTDSFLGNEFTPTGLINGDSVSSVTLTSSGTAVGANAGTYAIVPSAAVGTGLTNYSISYVNGTYTVNPLPATGSMTIN
jgi:hypothetical protein